MAISPKHRFRILSRDNFACRYCGATAPNAVLQVDHIFPKSKGGKDIDTNLITSCFQCNIGKGAEEVEIAAPTQAKQVYGYQEGFALGPAKCQGKLYMRGFWLSRRIPISYWKFVILARKGLVAGSCCLWPRQPVPKGREHELEGVLINDDGVLLKSQKDFFK